MVQLLGVVWVLGLWDLFFTLWAHRFTEFYDWNPVVSVMLHLDATRSLVLFKLAMTATGSVVFWKVRSHRKAEVALWVVAAAYVLLAFQWSAYTCWALTGE